jgi:hypothetical protein
VCVTKLLGFVPAWWLIQTAPPSPEVSTWGQLGIGFAMAVLIAALWREDRKSRIEHQASSDDRYTELVKMLTGIIERNTTASVQLGEKLSGKITNCPLAADPVMRGWMHAFAEHSERQRQHDEVDQT